MEKTASDRIKLPTGGAWVAVIVYEIFINASLLVVQVAMYLGGALTSGGLSANGYPRFYTGLEGWGKLCAALIIVLAVTAASLCLKQRHRRMAATVVLQGAAALYSLYGFQTLCAHLSDPDTISELWFLTPYLLTLFILGACDALLPGWD